MTAKKPGASKMGLPKDVWSMVSDSDDEEQEEDEQEEEEKEQENIIQICYDKLKRFVVETDGIIFLLILLCLMIMIFQCYIYDEMITINYNLKKILCFLHRKFVINNGIEPSYCNDVPMLIGKVGNDTDIIQDLQQEEELLTPVCDNWCKFNKLNPFSHLIFNN